MTAAHGADDGLQHLRRDYRAAFFGYLPRRAEAPLHTAYKLGRAAVSSGLSILDLAEIHHQTLIEVLTNTDTDQLSGVATAASEFFLEVLATYEMARRGSLPEP
jgi:hypothetical protein